MKFINHHKSRYVLEAQLLLFFSVKKLPVFFTEDLLLSPLDLSISIFAPEASSWRLATTSQASWQMKACLITLPPIITRPVENGSVSPILGSLTTLG